MYTTWLSKLRGICINTFRYKIQGYRNHKYRVILLVRGVFSHTHKLHKNISVFTYGACGYRKYKK